MRLFLSIVIPVAFMYSFPAQALFGGFDLTIFLSTIAITVVFYSLSRLIWYFGIRRYESAMG